MITSAPTKKLMRTMLVLFALAGATFFTAACEYSGNYQIERALLQFHTMPENLSLQQVSDNAYKIYIQGCPSDFQIAWRRFCRSIYDLAQLENKYGSVKNAPQTELDKYVGEFFTDFLNLLDIADTYGVDTSKYRKEIKNTTK